MPENVKTSTAFNNLLRFCLVAKKKKITFVLILIFFFNLIELGLPKVLELYVKAFEEEDLTFLGADVSFLSTAHGKMILLPLILALIALARWVVTYLKVYYQGKLGQSVLMDIRRQIYDKVQSSSFDYHDRQHSGILISNLVEDVRYANMFFDQAIFLLLESVVFIVTVYLFLFFHSPAAAAASLLMLVAGYALALVNLKYSFPIYGQTKELFARKVALFTECMEGQLVINAYGQKAAYKERYAQRVRSMHASNLKEIRRELVSNQLVVWSTQLGVPVIIFVYIWSQQHLGLAVSGAVIILLFATQVLIISKSRQLARGTELLVRFAISSRRLHEFFKDAPIYDDSSGRAFPAKISSIEFRHVTFSYGDRQPILNDISFKFDHGHVLGLAGSTGAGKSSLVQLLAGFYQVDKGLIYINGLPLPQYQTSQLRNEVAIVFQETFLFAGSVHDNIAFGTPEASDDDVRWAADMAHASEFIDQLQDGYSTQIGEKGISLSGGQRQRLGLARALIQQPKILILDSCTSALDMKTEQAILSSLSQLRHIFTVIISHRPTALESSDYILVLEKGQLVQTGSPSQLRVPGSHYLRIMENTHD